jgi:hypothetical protein
MALSDTDVDETMAADWAAIREKHAVEEDPAPEPGGEADSGGEAEVPAAAAPATEGARARDDTGKFAKAGKEPKDDKGARTAPAKAAERGATAPAVEPADQAVQPAARDVNRAPSSWKPTERAEFDKLSPVVKAAIHRREQDFQNGQTQLLPDAQLGKGMRAAIEPYRMLIEAEGGTPERAVADLLKTAAIFRVGTNEQKAQAVAGIVRQYGVDMRVLFPGGQQPQNAQPQAFRDPRVDQLLANQNRERQESIQREQVQLESTVEHWMNETDAQGQPKRPYLGDVINEMSALVPQIRHANPALTHAQALEQAYERAIWAHPEVRTVLQQKAAADLQASTRAANQTRVSDARRAASVNVRPRGSLPSAGKPGAMEDTIAATARELGLIT